MKRAALKGLIVGAVLGAMYVSCAVGWQIGRWCYITFG